MDPNSNTNADTNSNFSQEATNNPPPSNEPTPQSYRYEEGRANSKIVISEDEMEYLRNRTSKTSISVVCRFYHKKDDDKCNGRASIDLKTNKLIITQAHNHGCEKYNRAKETFKKKIYEEAIKNPEKGAKHIFENIKRAEKDRETRKITFASIKSTINRRRRTNLPRVPSSPTEFANLIEGSEKYKKHYLGSVIDKKGQVESLLFGSEQLLKAMEATANIAFDGTFSITPKTGTKKALKQTFIISFKMYGNYFPGVFALMNGKKTKKYASVFQKVKELIPNLEPIQAMADFERAAQNGCSTVFDGINTHICLFHQNQAVFRKVQEVRLVKKYSKDVKFKRWIRLVMAVPLLPSHSIEKAYTILLKEKFPLFNKKDLLRLAEFKRYIREFWRDDVSPDLLSVWGLMDATNNTSESFNSYLTKKIPIEHPNPWLFLNKIYEVIEDKEIDFSCLEEDPEVVITKKKTKYAMLLNERRKAESAFEETGDILGFLGSVCKTSEGVRKRLLQQFRREKKRLKKDKGKDSNDSISAEVEPIQANLCSVCGDEIEKAYFLFPCGDSSFCKPCAKELHDNNKKCPIDGSEILGIAPKK